MSQLQIWPFRSTIGHVLSLVVLFLAAPAAVDAQSAPPACLAPVQPSVTLVQEPGAWWIAEHDLAERLTALAAQLKRRFPSGRGLRGLYRVPGAHSRLLLVASGEERPEDYGYRVMLAAAEPDSVQLLSIGSGLMDSDWAKPVFYVGQGRTFVLLDTGSEYSWGLSAYEIAGDSLRGLGTVDAAAPPETPEEGATGNPLGFARVCLRGELIEVEFTAPVVFMPGSETGGELLPASSDAPVVFRFGGTTFERVTSRPAT